LLHLASSLLRRARRLPFGAPGGSPCAGSPYTAMFTALRHDIHDLDQVSRICRASHESIFVLMGKVVEQAVIADMFVTPAKQETADDFEGRYG